MWCKRGDSNILTFEIVNLGDGAALSDSRWMAVIVKSQESKDQGIVDI